MGVPVRHQDTQRRAREDILKQLGTIFEELVRRFNEEINAETYAIAKADLLLKGEGEAADNIIGNYIVSILGQT